MAEQSRLIRGGFRAFWGEVLVARREYTAEEKAEALRLYVEVGLCQSAKLTGIPKSTIRDWAKAAGVQTDGDTKTAAAIEAAKARAERARAERNALFPEVALELLKRIRETDSPSGCKDLATAAAILTDKDQLVSGKATGREEHVHDLSNRSTEDLIQEAEALTRRAADRRGTGAA
jgi:transposase-like protein